ncbi:F-box/LRR-repeat protein 4 [Phlebotomus argentipes]|uniref:F-box/LRR-repeat protein 4 n=1 Tax=Phlebotomus argentipes TaxID=94469 RepID=UPI0028932D53|nr:F-box/LRR-repeat protein 4 [Phlebotomus argentipes]
MFSETDTSVTSSEDLTAEEAALDEIQDKNLALEEVIINQYAQKVIDFSSQYGSDTSISYTAYNITGRPSKFPDYGDFPETFAMRTYGPWWDIAPSTMRELQPSNIQDIPIHDFIVVEFEEFVIPHAISIYETYNPGAIVKIWAFFSTTDTWHCLWSSYPDPDVEKWPRKFAPEIKRIPLPTKILRLEFNHVFLDYFTEIDGIELTGRKCDVRDVSDSATRRSKKGPIQRKLESVQFKLRQIENHTDILKDFLANDLGNFMKEAGLVPEEIEDNTPQITLKDLPCEILFKILSYLDLVSIFRTAQVCRKLYDVATDPFLYQEINLKPYWHSACDELLATLTKRATLLKKLDLSWCGLFHVITPSVFKEFVRNCCKNLTHLRLNSCKFINAGCMEIVGSVCVNLRELCLRNYTKPPSVLNFHCLKNLRCLERLDLFRTQIDSDLLLMTLRYNPALKHLNLGICSATVNMDDVAIQISRYNRSMVSIDMWKSHYLSSVGLLALSQCHDLEEVDFGWCLREEASPGESLKILLKSCPRLKKVFLAAIRGINDRDLENITEFCPNLEQLDLMGVLGITYDMCYKILSKCHKLKVLDLSFCDQIDELQIALWRDVFGVSIKRNFEPLFTSFSLN